MSLRSEPGAMSRYHRQYARRRSLPANERKALDGAIEAVKRTKCNCQGCKVLRAIGTLRGAVNKEED